MPNRLMDLTGQRFGDWTVISRAPDCRHNNSRWLCQCECGTVRSVASASLRRGISSCCGRCLPPAHLIHGMNCRGKRTPEYAMWANAKQRAKKSGIPFDLDPTDIVIPERCPCLGIPLEHGTREQKRSSPSLDRIIPALGYVRGNVWVISQKANAIKNDGTVDEIMAVAFGLAQMQDRAREAAPARNGARHV